jgi:hypothetical protein
MKVQKFKEYSKQEEMAFDLINSFDKMILESDGIDYVKVQKKVISDLKLNGKMRRDYKILSKEDIIWFRMLKNTGGQVVVK